MNTPRYMLAAVGLFILLLVTILASIFGWGLQAATLATTMIANPRQETGHTAARFHIWHPFFGHRGHSPAPVKPAH